MDMEERDAHLFAEMSKRKRAILGLDWAVEPPRNASAAEKADADYLHELLLDLEGLEDLLLDALDGIGHGYSCIELEWALQGASGCRWRSTTDRRAGSSSTPKTRTSCGCATTARPAKPCSPSAGSFTGRVRSGYVARSGLFRVLAWPYLFRHYATSDLAEMLEIYGLPIRLGKYPPGTADEEKATLLRAVTGLGHAAAGIIPETMAIDFQQAAQGSSEPFLAMMRQSEDAISKAVLGGT
ncbi:phage portal protein family protein [Pseudomonas aeruginosa]|uniref:phage portal protein family protein n=1 Tax=Pseudomonas aeruginosa TaxID=287 RepID=UPI00214B95E3|nr:DUF935 family protein [Pseudomonas aeruginosa]